MNLTAQDMADMVEGYRKTDFVKFKVMPRLSEEDRIINDWFEEEDIHPLVAKYKKKAIEIQNILIKNGII